MTRAINKFYLKENFQILVLIKGFAIFSKTIVNLGYNFISLEIILFDDEDSLWSGPRVRYIEKGSLFLI